jgi:hypothetical protein
MEDRPREELYFGKSMQNATAATEIRNNKFAEGARTNNA